MFPPGWKSLNLSLEKLSLCIKAIAKQSPNNNEILVEVVGTISVGSDSTTYQVTKLRNRTVQLEGGGTEDNAIYGIGVDASAREISGHPNAGLSVALPKQ